MTRRARRWALEGAALVLLLAALAGRSLQRSQDHYVPVFDEVAYLEQARDFGRWGELGTIACYVRARCRDDNRHPLYSMIAAPWMRGDEADFPREKLLTLGCALALVLVVYGFAASSFAGEAALTAAAFAALSFTLAFLGQQVLSDVLFAVLYVGALAVLLRWRDRLFGWAAFGALAGLAYLDKGSGHFILLSAVALAALEEGPRAWRYRRLWTALAAFAAVAGWLLWRNLSVWGTPFHSAGGAVMWLDDWDSMWRLNAAGQLRQAGPLAYWRAHTLAQMAARLWRGAGLIAVDMIETAGPGPTLSARPAGLLVMLLAALGLRDRWRRGGRAEAIVILAPAAALLAALAWAAVAGVRGTRFMLPIVATLWPAAAFGVAELARLAGEDAAAEGFKTAAKGIVVASAALGLLFWRDGFSRAPLSLWAQPPHWEVTARWLKEHAGDRRFLIAEDSRFSLWNEGADRRYTYPFGSSDEELERYRDSAGLDFVLLDSRAESYAQHPLRYESAGVDAYGPVSFLGWPRCFHDPLQPSQFEVFCRPK